MSRLLRRFPPLLIVAFLACGKDSTAPDEPGPPTDIAGTWTYREILENSERHITCFDQGTIVISQSDADLTGTVTQFGSCDAPGGSFDNSGTASIAGNVGAATVRFAFAGCAYHGDLFNTPRDSALGTVECNVTAGPLGRIQLTGTWSAIKGSEIFPPVVTGSISAPVGDTMFVTGETLRLAIAASDDHKLHWVGYRIGAPANVQDSTLTVDTTFSDTVDIVVPASWDGSSDVTVWARDAADNRTEQTIGHVRTVDAVRRPFQTLPLDTRAVDAVYDPTRNVMYFSQPDSARVAVLSLASFTLDAPIPIPIPKSGRGILGIDIVPGGDSVVIALPDTSKLGLLNRVSGTISTTPIVAVEGGNNLRVTSTRKAMVFGSVDSGYIFFAIAAHDLPTGTDSLRRDVGQSGHLNATATMFRSPDQSKVLVLSIGAPSCGYVYDAAANSFSACSAFGFSSYASATATTNGSTWLVGDKLLDGSLNVLSTVPGLTPETHASIAPDGSVAYRPSAYGYDKIALPAGTVLERVRIPVQVARVSVFPDGGRLFLWTDPIPSPPLTATYRVTVVTLP